MPQNRILPILLQRHPQYREQLKRVDFVHGELFGRAGEPIRYVVFPSNGLISVVVELSGGDLVEAAMIGRDGMIGGAVALGASTHVNTSFAQLPGAAHLLPASALIDMARDDAAVRSLVFAHEQFVLAQSQQAAACNARHHIPQRLSSWLLRAQEASGETELVLTQEFLAQMLGVQRASVSMFAGQLQDKELIRYRRGRLSIVNHPGLAAEACECLGVLQGARRRLLGDEEGGRSQRAAG